MRPKTFYKVIVIGGSAGSMEVLSLIFSNLPKTFNLPIIVVCHLHPKDDGSLADFFCNQRGLPVKEAVDKELVRAGNIYFPPADYHLLVEQDKTFALSIDPKVNYSRPSIDVFFESAALAWGEALVGIILTGASSDGTAGIEAIKRHGGLTIAQDPEEASFRIMPQAAINSGAIDKVLSVKELIRMIEQLLSSNLQELR